MQGLVTKASRVTSLHPRCFAQSNITVVTQHLCWMECGSPISIHFQMEMKMAHPSHHYLGHSHWTRHWSLGQTIQVPKGAAHTGVQTSVQTDLDVGYVSKPSLPRPHFLIRTGGEIRNSGPQTPSHSSLQPPWSPQQSLNPEFTHTVFLLRVDLFPDTSR